MNNNMKNVSAAFVIGTAAFVAAPFVTNAEQLKDVQPSNYFYADVLDLHARGIISGYEDGTFKPEKELTRGQAAKIMAGVLQLDTKNVENPNFSDIPTTHQYYGAIAALKQAGIIDGYEDGSFRQGELVQRNHIAKILASAMNLQAKDVENVPFTDVRADYKEAIAALYEHGITTGKTAETFDGTAFVTRGQMAAFVARAEKAAQQEAVVSFDVTDFNEHAISTNERTYQLDEALQVIFSKSNKEALTNAKATVVVKNNKIIAIKQLTLNNAGTEKANVMFSTNGATVEALTINAANITVANTIISTNLVISNTVTSEILLDNVTTNGDVVLESDAVSRVAAVKAIAQTNQGAKLKLKNSTMRSMQIHRNAVTIISDKQIAEIKVTALVTEINVEAPVKTFTVLAKKLEVTGNAVIQELLLTTSSQLDLHIIGEISALIVNSEDTRVTMGTQLSVDKLTIPSDMKPAQIIENFNEVSNKIEHGTLVPAPAPAPSGNGGSKPTVTKETAQAEAVAVLETHDFYLYIDAEQSWEIYNALLAVIKDAQATVTDYQNAVKAYKAAILTLEKRTEEQYAKRLAYRDLQEVLDALNANDYENPEEAKAIFSKYSFSDNETITAADVLAMKSALENEIQALTKVSLEKTALYNALKALEWDVENYVDEQAAEMVIATAQQVYDDENATDLQLKEAQEALEASLKVLEQKTAEQIAQQLEAAKALFDEAVENAKQSGYYETIGIDRKYEAHIQVEQTRDLYLKYAEVIDLEVAKKFFEKEIDATEMMHFVDQEAAKELIAAARVLYYTMDVTAVALNEAKQQFIEKIATLELASETEDNKPLGVTVTYQMENGQGLELTAGESIAVKIDGLEEVVPATMVLADEGSVTLRFYYMTFEGNFTNEALLKDGFTFDLNGVTYEVQPENNDFIVTKKTAPTNEQIDA